MLPALIRRGVTHPELPPRSTPCRGVTQRASTDVFPIKPEWMGDALLFIRHHVADGISSADVCRHVERSHTLVSANFKKLLKTTIQTEITRVQLQEAQRLLRAGLPPAKVSALAGFRSLTYFSTRFSKAFGMPPSAFAGSVSPRRMNYFEKRGGVDDASRPVLSAIISSPSASDASA